MGTARTDLDLRGVTDHRRLGLLRSLWAFPSARPWRLAVVAVLALGATFAQGASVGLLLPAAQVVEDPTTATPGGTLGEAVDWVLSAVDLPRTMPVLFAAVFLMVVLAQLLMYAHLFVSTRVIEELIADLRRAAFRGFMYARMPFHYAHRSGVLTSALIADGSRAESALAAVQDVVMRLVMLTLYAVLLLLISWQTALIALGVVTTVSLLTQLWLNTSRRTGEHISGLFEEIQSFATERIQGVREVKLAGREDKDSRRFDAAANALAAAMAKLGYRVGQIRLVSEPVLIGVGLLTVFVGSSVVGLSLAELAVFIFVLLRIVPEARALNNARYRISGYGNSVRVLLDLVEAARWESEYKEAAGRPTSQVKRSFAGVSKGISWEGVSFAYQPGSTVLANLTFSVAVGQTTAIVGPSGAGKSTILALLVRLLTQTSGRILFDGTPIEEFDLSSLRRGVGLVTQDAALFNDTVIENIKLGQPEATMEEVEHAAQLANADGFIRELPRGYETVVGDRGVALSVGQRQRLALARALLTDPSVLLLDEVTSAQDPESERALQEAVWRASTGRTVVIVTHRLSSIQGVDRVLVLQDGQFVEDGTPEDLLKKGGLFRHYYDIQIGSGWLERT